MFARNRCVCNKCNFSKLSEKKDSYGKENNVFQEENKLIYDIVNNKLTIEDIIRAIIKSNNINIDEKKILINYVENNIRKKIINIIDAKKNNEGVYIYNTNNKIENFGYKENNKLNTGYKNTSIENRKNERYIEKDNHGEIKKNMNEGKYSTNNRNNEDKYTTSNRNNEDKYSISNRNNEEKEEIKKNINEGKYSTNSISNMNREKKKEYLVDFLRKNNLRVKRANNDGNCLFNSLSLMLYGNERYSKYLREEAVLWIEENIEKEINGIKIKNMIFLKSSQKSYTDYLNDMLKDGEWGDYVCLIAICYNRMINVNLVIMDSNDIYVEDIDYIITNKNIAKNYWIQYNQCELHYNCLSFYK